MHLTNSKCEPSDSPVAGESVRLALEEEFQDWMADNDYLLSNGLPGDVEDLLVRLTAASAKALMSS